MGIHISVNVHATSDNEPEFEVYRQNDTGTMVLKIDSSDYPSLAVFLDEVTLGALHRAVKAGVAAEVARLEDLRDDHTDAGDMLAATAVFDMIQALDTV